MHVFSDILPESSIVRRTFICNCISERLFACADVEGLLRSGILHQDVAFNHEQEQDHIVKIARTSPEMKHKQKRKKERGIVADKSDCRFVNDMLHCASKNY